MALEGDGLIPLYREARIERALDEKLSLDLARSAFRMIAAGTARMPEKVYLPLAAGSDFRAMPAVAGDACGMKWVGVFPRNPSRGLPTVRGLIVLSASRTGETLALLEAAAITAYRTAAAAALSTMCLAPPRPRVLALVGAGVQAAYQLRAHARLIPFESVRVCGATRTETLEFHERWRGRCPALVPAADIRECVRGADVIVTCTPSRRPIVLSRWVKDGTHVCAIGADAKGKRELDTRLVLRGKVVVDEWRQASHSGEINVPCALGRFDRSRLRAELADVVSGRVKGRRSASEVTIFDSTGLAVLDIRFASYLHALFSREDAGRRPRR